MDNTIVAISTAAGNGGIGIVRLTGEDTFKIIEKIFKPKSNNNEIKGYTMKYGNIVNPKNNEIIDEVLVSYFVSPKSYTRENMCEINTHGGMVVEKRILEVCLENGAELAEPGEFTKRAFLNGRIDLSQAEAIIDLINSKSEKEAKESVNQLEGNLSKKINEITVILGKPNAGKSSLLNAILNEERAIVSSIEGTTRDTIEEYIHINGISLKLIDTAGIRDADNEIERIGVDKSKKLAESSDLIIAIFDTSRPFDKEDEEIVNIIKDKKAIVLLNKIDIGNTEEIEAKLNDLNKPII